MVGEIVIVSGLPRSGTSLMMQILEKGKVPILTDNIRVADSDNKKGYYEYEKVKSLARDNSWLHLSEDKAVKVVSHLLQYLPNNFRYKVIFMIRDLDEVILSQNKMMSGLGTKDSSSDLEMKNIFEKHLSDVKSYLESKPFVSTRFINFSDCIADPEDTSKKIIDFLSIDSDFKLMASCVDRTLYRNRRLG